MTRRPETRGAPSARVCPAQTDDPVIFLRGSDHRDIPWVDGGSANGGGGPPRTNGGWFTLTRGRLSQRRGTRPPPGGARVGGGGAVGGVWGGWGFCGGSDVAGGLERCGWMGLRGGCRALVADRQCCQCGHKAILWVL